VVDQRWCSVTRRRCAGSERPALGRANRRGQSRAPGARSGAPRPNSAPVARSESDPLTRTSSRTCDQGAQTSLTSRRGPRQGTLGWRPARSRPVRVCPEGGTHKSRAPKSVALNTDTDSLPRVEGVLALLRSPRFFIRAGGVQEHLARRPPGRWASPACGDVARQDVLGLHRRARTPPRCSHRSARRTCTLVKIRRQCCGETLLVPLQAAVYVLHAACALPPSVPSLLPPEAPSAVRTAVTI
jgi:hypothetical protein